jgi:hypothetical protein
VSDCGKSCMLLPLRGAICGLIICYSLLRAAALTIARMPVRIASGSCGHALMRGARAGSTVASAPDSAPRSEENAVFAGFSGRVRIPPSPLQFWSRLQTAGLERVCVEAYAGTPAVVKLFVKRRIRLPDENRRETHACRADRKVPPDTPVVHRLATSVTSR